MAAIDFPASPTLNQVFASTNGVNYQWNGTMWLAVGPTSLTTSGGDFSANQRSAFPTLTSSNVTLKPSQNIVGNSGGWYSTSTGRYTPPAGRYHIIASLSAYADGLANLNIVLRKNGTVVQDSGDAAPSANYYGTPTVSLIVDANGTDWWDFQGSTGAVSSTMVALTFQAFPLSGIKGPPGDPGNQIVTFNRLHNAGLLICDKGTGPFGTGLPGYAHGFNRWAVASTGAAATFVRVQAAKGLAHQFTGIAGNTAVKLAQGLESGDCTDLASQPMCLGAVVSSSHLTTMSWRVSYCNTTNDHVNRTQIATGTFPMTTTPTLQTATFNAGANAANGLLIEFFTAALVASRTWTISQPQLVTGSVPITFWVRPVAEEANVCARYYRYGDNIHIGFLPSGSPGAWRHTVELKPPMFRAPTVNFTGQGPSTYFGSGSTSFAGEWNTGSGNGDARWMFNYTAEAEPLM